MLLKRFLLFILLGLSIQISAAKSKKRRLINLSVFKSKKVSICTDVPGLFLKIDEVIDKVVGAEKSSDRTSVSISRAREVYGQAVFHEKHNAEKSLLFYHEAAKLGDVNAQAYLGFSYMYGGMVPRDYAQAVYWLNKAGRQRCAESLYHLSICYDQGLGGLPANFDTSFLLLTASSVLDYDGAHYGLAQVYEYGIGVPVDKNKAQMLYERAAAQGNNQAQRQLYLLGNELNRNSESAIAKRFSRAQGKTNGLMRLEDSVSKEKKPQMLVINNATIE